MADCDTRPHCKYGSGCYQKNPEHKKRFQHPAQEAIVAPGKRRADEVQVESAKKARVSLEAAEEIDSTKEMVAGVDTLDKSNQDPTGNNDVSQTAEESSAAAEDYTDILPASPPDLKDRLRQKFLVDFPPDFFQFWEFCRGINHDSPELALTPETGLRLVGPYDLVAGRIPVDVAAARSAKLYLLHYRYYYDPPEFQTVITAEIPPLSSAGHDEANKSAADTSLFHMGYFRDDPAEAPVFVAGNNPTAGPKITPLAENIFGAVYQYLGQKIGGGGGQKIDPFARNKLNQLREKIKASAGELGLSVDAKTPAMRQRDRVKMVCRTFHGAGLVVPYNKKTQVGYREIPETTASLTKIFRNVVSTAEEEDESARNRALDTLQELVTNVQFANDEGDPGMGLELGLDGFCHGGAALHGVVGHLLAVGYELVGRPEFGRIAAAHLARRAECGSMVDMFQQFRK